MLVAELTHLMEVNFAYGIAPPCRNPFTGAARSTVSNARDAGVQTNQELCCDTKRIITRRLDRSYISATLLPLSSPQSPRLSPSLPVPHARNNVKLFAPPYVNFRKCALSLLLLLLLLLLLHKDSFFGISLCQHRGRHAPPHEETCMLNVEKHCTMLFEAFRVPRVYTIRIYYNKIYYRAFFLPLSLPRVC